MISEAEQNFEIGLGDILDKMNQGIIHPHIARKQILDLLPSFKSDVCKKQREECRIAYNPNLIEPIDIVEESILNAPEPE